MKIALVLTVKNEERLLRNNVLYHKAIGVDKTFVYFDKTTDNGKESIKDLDFVEINDSVPAKDFLHLSYLEKFTAQAKDHHTARQCLNAFDASLKAEKEGFDWLLCLDPDELVATSEDKISDLKSFLRDQESEIDAVNFQMKEVFQAKKNYRNVFEEETRFKALRNFKRYSMNIFKTFWNPRTQKKEKYVYWYGHNTGKMAIRLCRKMVPHNPHKFKKRDGKDSIIAEKGLLLHYHAYDAQDFIKKYRNFKDHPETFLSGNKVDVIKLLFIDVVNNSGMSYSRLEKYFEKYLMFNTREIRKLQRNKVYYLFPRRTPILVNITSVAKTFKEKINEESSKDHHF